MDRQLTRFVDSTDVSFVLTRPLTARPAPKVASRAAADITSSLATATATRPAVAAVVSAEAVVTTAEDMASSPIMATEVVAMAVVMAAAMVSICYRALRLPL